MPCWSCWVGEETTVKRMFLAQRRSDAGKTWNVATIPPSSTALQCGDVLLVERLSLRPKPRVPLRDSIDFPSRVRLAQKFPLPEGNGVRSDSLVRG